MQCQPLCLDRSCCCMRTSWGFTNGRPCRMRWGDDEDMPHEHAHSHHCTELRRHPMTAGEIARCGAGQIQSISFVHKKRDARSLLRRPGLFKFPLQNIAPNPIQNLRLDAKFYLFFRTYDSPLTLILGRSDNSLLAIFIRHLLHHTLTFKSAFRGTQSEHWESSVQNLLLIHETEKSQSFCTWLGFFYLTISWYCSNCSLWTWTVLSPIQKHNPRSG